MRVVAQQDLHFPAQCLVVGHARRVGCVFLSVLVGHVSSHLGRDVIADALGNPVGIGKQRAKIFIEPKAGQTVVVSAATGAVGSAFGALAKARGCRAVGIAGGPDKCKYAIDELGFDVCIDYKQHKDAASLSKALKEACPDGIDGYFENVGGMILDAVLSRMGAQEVRRAGPPQASTAPSGGSVVREATSVAELILHHYPTSPFSEKIRLILGYKKLAWKSVVIPSIMPKPDVLALTGGYRKTPFLQVGADIYCDSALIADVLEHLQPAPSLYPEPGKGLARTLAQWADSTLFWAAMAHNLGPRGAAHMFAGAPPEAAKAFGEDRKAMSGAMTRLRPADAAAAYKSYLRRLSDMLDDQPFLLGQVPCIADFAAYHPLWFTKVRTPVVADILAHTPAVIDWMDRMNAIGQGNMEKFDGARAIATAAAAEPMAVGHGLLTDSTFQDEHGIALGSRVSITAESFGPEPTEGELIAATRTHYTLSRTDERAGTVHVHFPRIGYALKAVAPA